MIRLFFLKKRLLLGQTLHNLPRTNYDSRDPVVDDFVCIGIFAITSTSRREQFEFHAQAEYKNFSRNASMKMLVLTRRQDGFRRIKLLPLSPIIVQRLVHCQWQTRKSSALSEINNLNAESEEAEVSRNSTFPKRVDSLWKVGANVSVDGGIENAVTNAASIGSVMNSCTLVIKTFDSLAAFIRANSFSFFLQSRRYSRISQSISEFKERMKQYGYANNMVLPSSKHHHLGNPDMFVLAPSSHF